MPLSPVTPPKAADIRPFYALRYRPDAVDDLGAVLGPPDDLATRQEALALASSHPLHSVHLELPDPDGAHYTEAAARLRRWLADGILQLDPVPALYLYEHRYRFDGQIHRRLGIFAALRLDDPDTRSVLPHESVTPGMLAQRLALIRTARAHLSAVYTVAPTGGRLQQTLQDIATISSPTVTAQNASGEHRLWAVTDRPAIGTVRAALAGTPLVIADGHHRYAAARRYRQELLQAGRDPGPAGFVLAFVADASDPGIHILPIHRIVRAFGRVPWPEFLARLRPYFEVDQHPLPAPGDHRAVEDAVRALATDSAPPVYLALAPGAHAVLRLQLARWESVEALLPRGRSQTYRQLDATVFESVVLQHALGLDGDQRERAVTFTPDVAEAVRTVVRSETQAAFFLRPTPLRDVLAVALAGEVMPPKSTYFYPKVPLGLVFYDLTGPEPA